MKGSEPVMEQLTPEHIKWLVGACGGVMAFLAGLVAAVVRATYKAGQHATRMEQAAEKVARIEKSVELIPIHEVRLGMLENTVARIASDIRELLRARQPSQWDSEE